MKTRYIKKVKYHVTQIKIWEIKGLIGLHMQKKGYDEKCPFVNNESVGANWWRAKGTVKFRWLHTNPPTIGLDRNVYGPGLFQKTLYGVLGPW